jgi:thiol-disulfide isomerase/thioredoxin
MLKIKSWSLILGALCLTVLMGQSCIPQTPVTPENDDAMMDDTDTTPPKDDVMMDDDANNTMTGDEDAMMTDPDSEESMTGPGSYETYAPAKLAKAGSGDVVLFFRASWCPTCKALDSDIQANLSDIPGDVTILDVDYDTETDLKKKYGVTYQHTLVQVDADGNLIKKWSGSPTLDSLISQIN